MRDVLLLLTLLLLAVLLVAVDSARDPARLPVAEGCLACHKQVDDPGPAHAVAAMGCSPCHGGNPDSRDKRRAHQGLVGNPGDLRVVDRTCGQADCHALQAARVRNSVMSTNAGILAALNRLWGVRGADSVQSLAASASSRSPAEDYYAKLCATCHFWRARDQAGEEPGLRGGGCSGCHVVRAAGKRDQDLTRLEHPRLSMRVPVGNCVRCHNRSDRIGLTYQGRLEDDGYGTPHANGEPGGRRLSGGRYYLQIPADVHFQAGMACIDCHTGDEVMGDGLAHNSLKDQLGVLCRDCHEPRFRGHAEPPADAVRLARLNAAVPPLETGFLARTRKGDPLYALRPVPRPDGGRPGRAVLYRKLDGKPLEISLDATPRPHHALPGHERLGCQACHSPLMPQCYGCHVVRHGNASQLDKMAGSETPGRWVEGRSFTRFRQPALGLARGEVVAPFSPCQVVVSVFDASGTYDANASVGSALMTSFDPHSTQLASRTCLDCHLDPKSLGLGSGRLGRGSGLAVRATYDARASNLGWAMAPDQMTGFDGRLLQGFPHAGDRPFNAGELRAVLGVAPCLPCHGAYEDPLWSGYREGRHQWLAGLARGCGLSARQRAGVKGPDSVQYDSLSGDSLSTMTPLLDRPKAGTERDLHNMLE